MPAVKETLEKDKTGYLIFEITGVRGYYTLYGVYSSF
jgi:hypothetical protein